MKILTNGHFDCFHKGHKLLLDYCIKASGACGHLRILVNSNRSTKESKKRLVDDLQDRINNIYSYLLLKREYCGLRNIPQWSIIQFDTEEELEELIYGYKPDMIVKGDDRTDVTQIVGHKDFPVCITPRPKHPDGKPLYSTTRILNEQKED